MNKPLNSANPDLGDKIYTAKTLEELQELWEKNEDPLARSLIISRGRTKIPSNGKKRLEATMDLSPEFRKALFANKP